MRVILVCILVILLIFISSCTNQMVGEATSATLPKKEPAKKFSMSQNFVEAHTSPVDSTEIKEINIVISKNVEIPKNLRVIENPEVKKLPAALQKNLKENRQQVKIPININEKIVSFSIDASVYLADPLSYVKVILYDNQGNEHLAYSAGYPLSGSFEVEKFCEETCVIDPVVNPANIKVYTYNAEIRIKDIHYVTEKQGIDKTITKAAQRNNQIDQKVKMYNSVPGSKWVAGRTGVSDLSYEEKKDLFNIPEGEELETYGFEYYTGGFFVPGGVIGSSDSDEEDRGGGFNPANPISFDWRDRHGKNWLTPVKNQAQCGSCWAFSAVGAVEQVVNLYYNQLISPQLSEQQVVSCVEDRGCRGGNSKEALSYIRNTGIAEYDCFNYTAVDASGCNSNSCDFEPVPCSDMCSNWENRVWKITGYEVLPAYIRTTEVKKKLIEDGPMSITYWTWFHGMTLVGFGEITPGNYYEDSTIMITEDDPLVGKTYWIIRNSWGSDWGTSGGGGGGYSRFVIPSDKFFSTLTLYAITTPIIPPPNYDIEVLCTDDDNDGYCFWGIGEQRPASCPASCQSGIEPDCDDSNATIGACPEDLVCGSHPYLPSGETNIHGEYASYGEISCCGDNPNEYAIDGYCCNSEFKIINSKEIYALESTIEGYAFNELFFYNNQLFTTTTNSVNVYTLNGSLNYSFDSLGSGSPEGIFVYKGKIYIADTENDRISVFNMNGNLHRFISADSPASVHIENDIIYVTSYSSDSIKSYTIDGEYIDTWETPTSAYTIADAFVYQGFLYAVANNIFSKYTLNGKLVEQTKLNEFPNIIMNDFSIYDNSIYVTLNATPYSIIKYDLNGKLVGSIGLFEEGMAPLISPKALAFYNDKLYVTDPQNQRILVFSKTQMNGCIDDPDIKISAGTQYPLEEAPDRIAYPIPTPAVYFEASATDIGLSEGECPGCSYVWSLDGETQSTSQTYQIAFLNFSDLGLHKITLKVTDSEAHTSEKSVDFAAGFVREYSQAGLILAMNTYNGLFYTNIKGKSELLAYDDYTAIDKIEISGNYTLRSYGSFQIYNNKFYLADYKNQQIQVADLNGNELLAWGEYGEEPGQFKSPFDTVVHNDEIYVADNYNSRIQVFDLQGNLVRILDQISGDVRSIDIYDNQLYALTVSSNKIYKMELNGTVIKIKYLGIGNEDEDLNDPYELRLYDDKVFITDSGNERIQVFDLNLNRIYEWGQEGYLPGDFNFPVSMTIDNSNIYVSDTTNKNIQVFSYNYTYPNECPGGILHGECSGNYLCEDGELIDTHCEICGCPECYLCMFNESEYYCEINSPVDIEHITDINVNETELVSISVEASNCLNLSQTYHISDPRFTQDGNLFTWRTVTGDEGVYPVTITVSNDYDNSTENLLIVVTSVTSTNEPPQIGYMPNITVTESENVTIIVNATDPDGDALVYFINDTVRFAQTDVYNNTFIWQTNYSDAGEYIFTIAVYDNYAPTHIRQALINVTVVESNSPPVVTPVENITVYEREQASFQILAYDLEGDNLTFSINDSRFSQFQNIFYWNTTPQDIGTNIFLITVSDGEYQSHREVVVTVLNVNEPPELAFHPNITISENEAAIVAKQASDPDGDELYFDINDSRFSSSGNYFIWQTGFDDTGTSSVELSVTDGEFVDSQDITITVNNVNRPPILDPVSDIEVDETQTVQITLSATDADEDDLEYGISNDWFIKTNNVFTWVTDYDDAGNYTVTVFVTDGMSQDEQTVHIHVNNLNRPPSINPVSSIEIDENELINIYVTGNDPDGDTLTYGINDSRFTKNGNTFTYQSDYDDASVFVVEIYATDGSLYDYEQATIIINDVNRAPTIESISDIVGEEGDLITVDVIAADADNDLLTYTINSTDFEKNGNSFTWQTDFNDAGTYSFQAAVSDGEYQVQEQFMVTINNVNRPPVLNPIEHINASESDLITITAIAADPDGDPITYSINDTKFTQTGNVFTLQTDYESSDSFAVTLTASDGELEDSQQVHITIENVNRAPQLEALSDISVSESEFVTITAIASDPDGDAITYSINDTRFTQTTNVFTWQTNYNDSGSYKIKISASDGELEDHETLTVFVGNDNRPPVLDNIPPISVNENELISISASATDPDNDPLAYSINDTRFSQDENQFSYQTNYEDSGEFYVRIGVSDSQMQDYQDVQIAISNVNRPPSINALPNINASENESVHITLTGQDPDNDSLYYSVNDSSFIQDENQFTWQTDFDDAGIHYFKFSVTDGDFVDEQIMSATITNVNRIPVIGSIIVSDIDEGDTVILTVSATDPDADPLTISVNDSRFIQDDLHSFHWDTNPGDRGSVSVLIQVTDNQSTVSEATQFFVNKVLPQISGLECKTQNIWSMCNNIAYGETIQAMRVVCTKGNGDLSTHFALSNNQDGELLSGDGEQESEYWVFDHEDYTLEDSGEMSIIAVCNDSEDDNTTQVNWDVPWGVISCEHYQPSSGILIEPNAQFTYSTSVSCLNGECGNIIATLDPLLSLNKPASASSSENLSFLPEKAFDGSIGEDSRWLSSSGTDQQWIVVDLSQNYEINSAVISWFGLPAQDYELQVSTDSSNWINVPYSVASEGSEDTLTFAAQESRYVRIYCNELPSGATQYSISEISVYGSQSSSQKGVVPTTQGAWPFYTTDNNPVTCSDLKSGDSCQTSWIVIADTHNATYTFFVSYEPQQSEVESKATDYIIINVNTLVCENVYDTPPCNTITMEEVANSLDGWYQDNISLTQLMHNLILWRNN